MADAVEQRKPVFDKNKIQWPLSYSMRPCPPGGPPRQWWSYDYYRGPQNRTVQILYSKSTTDSELIAQRFLNEPVLGFDMEWPWDQRKHTRLQDKVALIQIACEDKIALFHIALHDGRTSQELIAPSLRRIIESVDIIKTGVSILQSDFKRLSENFQLEPRGALELSHLHRLVIFGSHKPSEVTTKLCSLTRQVERHLGLPLKKDEARMSNWSLPLNSLQKAYAANDAYAGYMLFHCMNAKRLHMNPIPPLPRPAESYLSFELGNIVPVQLEPATDKINATPTTVKGLFDAARSKPKHTKDEEMAPSGSPVAGRGQANSSTPITPLKIDMSCKLYRTLAAHRKRVAEEEDFPLYIIASNKVLEELTRRRPVNKKELLEIHGVGENKANAYGDEWLRIIARDIAEHPQNQYGQTSLPLQPTTPNPGIAPQKSNHQKPLNSSQSAELYKRLARHRFDSAYAQDWAAYRVASNKLLTALVQARPSNNDELLLVKGVGQAKAAVYGPDWLNIIADFMAEPEQRSLQVAALDTPTITRHAEHTQLPQPASGSPLHPSDQPPKRNIIRNVGRSKELVLPQPTLSTGLSFQFAETQLSADEATVEGGSCGSDDECDDSSAFGPPLALPSSSQLKRKRADSSTSDSEVTRTSPLMSKTVSHASATLDTEAAQPEPFSPEQKLLRKKLDAYVKSVVWVMNPKPTQPIVSEDTLDYLVANLPRTVDEFHKVPGIQRFLRACESVKKDLWLTFSTWTQIPGLRNKRKRDDTTTVHSTDTTPFKTFHF